MQSPKYTTIAFLSLTVPDEQRDQITDLGITSVSQLYRLKDDPSPENTHRALLGAGFEPVDRVRQLLKEEG